MDIENVIGKMTLEDKIALCSGASFWETKTYEKYGIPSLFMCDGPHGLRKQDREGGADMLGVNESRPATCFPAEVTTAASWDSELLHEIGKAIGQEAKAQDIGLVLGPGANMKRNPLCGRNFEYFSEDPYLAGKLAAGFIKGVESKGIGSSLKHFAANSQEKSRFNSDSVMDERTLREIYLTAFEIAVKEGKPSTVMCAYPMLNGVYCSDNKELLTDILRTEWGFDGMVITDWGAMHDRTRGFRAGCDLNMPGGSEYMEKEVLQALKSGALSESAVDNSVKRILKLVFQAEQTLKEPTDFDKTAHHALARKAAGQAAVLLKNEDSILPLQTKTKIAVIGSMAKVLRYQGAGSSHINPTRVSQPLDSLSDAVYVPGCDERGDTTDELIAEAKKTAETAQVAVVFAGLPARFESEGFDRDDMKMPEGHLRMIDAVSSVNSNTIVVLFSGCVVECPWAERVKAILYMGLPGQAGGEAVSDLLYGKVNPSGKLAESWPIQYEDCISASYYSKSKDALYLEGLYIGYRYYDKVQKAVRWPFGYGLSYTQFAYSDMKIDGDTVTATVANIGSCAGAEVVQLYVAPPQNGIHRPVKELKGFCKVFLQAGENQAVHFELTSRDFSVWQNGWQLPKGDYMVHIGGSSRELPLCKPIYKDGVNMIAPCWHEDTWYETLDGAPTQHDLETVMGKTYMPQKISKGQFTMDNTVEEMKDYALIMKIMYKAVEATIAKGFGGKKDYENPEFRMLMTSSAGSPLRSMQISGGMKGGVLPGLLEMANGRFFKGILKMIKG